MEETGIDYERLSRVFTGIARRWVEEHDVEDVVQEGLLHAFRAVEKTPDVADPSALGYVSGVRRMRTYLTGVDRRLRQPTSGSQPEDPDWLIEEAVAAPNAEPRWWAEYREYAERVGASLRQEHYSLYVAMLDPSPEFVDALHHHESSWRANGDVRVVARALGVPHSQVGRGFAAVRRAAREYARG